MSEENKALVHRWTEEIWNQGSMSAIDEIVAADYVHHDPLMPEMRGAEALKQLLVTLRAAFPDGRFTEDALIAEGDMAVMRWTYRGTHKGEWIGVAGTGSLAEITGTTSLRLAGGKVAEHWAHWDALGWVRQVEGAAKAAVRRYLDEILNNGNLDLVEEIFTPDSLWRLSHTPDMRGYEARKQYIIGARRAYPDLRITMTDLIAEGAMAAGRWTFTGTHQGEWMGVAAPTGKQMTWSGATTFHFVGGRIAEELVEWDALAAYQQLGIPAQAQPMRQVAG